MDLIGLSEAAKFVKEKFNATDEEIFYWITHNCNLFPRYDNKGNSCGLEFGDYYDRNTIETFDFPNKSLYPQRQKVPQNEIEGNIIPHFQAANIIRNKLRKISKIKEITFSGDNYTIYQILLTLRAFKDNIPDSDGYFYALNSPCSPILALFYSEKEVEDINVLDFEEFFYINFEQLMKRDGWKRNSDDDVCLFLLRMNEEQRLKAIDHHYYTPCETNDPKNQPSHYGIAARTLIGDKEALFPLSEIISIEKNFFTTSDKVKIPKSTLLMQRKKFFEEVLKEAKNNGKEITKQNFIGKVHKKIIETELGKKSILEDTVRKNFDALVASGDLPPWKEIKAQLKTAANAHKEKMKVQSVK